MIGTNPQIFIIPSTVCCILHGKLGIFLPATQHYFDSTIADESFTICPSPQMQNEGDAGKILHCKNTLHTPGRLEKRT